MRPAIVNGGGGRRRPRRAVSGATSAPYALRSWMRRYGRGCAGAGRVYMCRVREADVSGPPSSPVCVRASGAGVPAVAFVLCAGVGPRGRGRRSPGFFPVRCLLTPPFLPPDSPAAECASPAYPQFNSRLARIFVMIDGGEAYVLRSPPVQRSPSLSRTGRVGRCSKRCGVTVRR
ncbi:hypothetical protein B0H11DRAFT_2079759 [Mycena galericulata]|nr:hypothetical protein B0H11DRAFT_2079759 [Mycena galericulata]